MSCGCNRRKKKLNKLLPALRLGDKVEVILKVTGIKSIVDKLTQNTEEQDKDELELRNNDSP